MDFKEVVFVGSKSLFVLNRYTHIIARGNVQISENVKKLVSTLVENNVKPKSFNIANGDIDEVFRNFGTPITGESVGFLPHLLYYCRDNLKKGDLIPGNNGVGGAILGMSQKHFEDMVTGNGDQSWLVTYQVHPV